MLVSRGRSLLPFGNRAIVYRPFSLLHKKWTLAFTCWIGKYETSLRFRNTSENSADEIRAVVLIQGRL